MKYDETCREIEDEGQMKAHNPWQKSVAFAHDGEPSSSQRPRNAAMNSMGARMPMSFTPMQADLNVSMHCKDVNGVVVVSRFNTPKCNRK